MEAVLWSHKINRMEAIQVTSPVVDQAWSIVKNLPAKVLMSNTYFRLLASMANRSESVTKAITCAAFLNFFLCWLYSSTLRKIFQDGDTDASNRLKPLEASWTIKQSDAQRSGGGYRLHCSACQSAMLRIVIGWHWPDWVSQSGMGWKPNRFQYSKR